MGQVVAAQRSAGKTMLDEQEIVRRLTDAGWNVITDEGFIGLIGPFVQKGSGTDLHFGFPTDARHRNLRGVLQGGALMTFADRAMGITARAAKQATRSATVQLDVHFADAVQLGEFVETRPRVIRATRQMAFMSALLTVADRVVASANGVWRILG
jgi:acyl-coenzyme A thioesterase PaaI-like protein